MKSCFAFVVGLSLALLNVAIAEEVVFSDHFEQLPSGAILGEMGAESEYHYLRATAPIAGWTVASFRPGYDWSRAWRGIEEGGKRIVAHTMPENNLRDTHPMLTAGDSLWKDYTLRVRVAPESLVSDKSNGLCGVAFRYVSSRSCYVFGLGEQRAFIKMVKHGTAFQAPYEKVLAEKPFAYKAGQYIDITVVLEGERIRVAVDNQPLLEATDATYAKGKIALVTDVAARFSEVSVTMTSDAKKAFLADRAKHDAEELALQEKNPKMVLWKTISTRGFGTGRNIRFGDLDGDGKLDIAIGQMVHFGPADSNAETSCVTAINTDGKILWQFGQPDPWKVHLTNDVAFQIHDFDGDGQNEVIFCQGQKIIVLNGATGTVKTSVPTPEVPKPKAGRSAPRENKWFPRILGDALFFCDVRGTRHKADMVIKDRYSAFWVYDNQFNLLWDAQGTTTGHYPHAADVDGDGKDEVLIGYTLYDDDGRVIWTLQDKLADHADGVALVKLHPDDAGYSALIAASDEGVLVVDMQGNILRHHFLGHVQNPGIADFRPDLPGLEIVTVNFWGNQGIIHFYDSRGDVYLEMEPFSHGSVCLPVNWTGKQADGELVMFSPNYDDGGLIDGLGRRAVRMPGDGFPDLCCHAADFTGDCRDEIVVWDSQEIRIYTQSDNPLSGEVYKPQRNEMCNDSNYRTYISLPPPSTK